MSVTPPRQLMLIGSWPDFLVRPDFLSWLASYCVEILVSENYWAPEFRKIAFVRSLPEDVLDRHEILLIPRRHRLRPISISWSMPLCLVLNDDGLGLSLHRGVSCCRTCFYRSPGAYECRKLGTRNSLDVDARDLGGCPSYRMAGFMGGPITMYNVPVWWRDSDWTLSPHRYHPWSLHGPTLKRLLAGETVTRPLRKSVIPATPWERTGARRPLPGTKKSWLAFMRKWTADLKGNEAFLEDAEKRAFVSC